MTDHDKDKKTLVLTGASRGIGHATVKRFSEEGWRVITCSRNAFPEDCPWPAGEEDHLQINLSDRMSIEAGSPTPTATFLCASPNLALFIDGSNLGNSMA